MFIQKYMLLNTDNASTKFLLIIVLDLKWTAMDPNDEGLNDNKLIAMYGYVNGRSKDILNGLLITNWTVNFSVFRLLSSTENYFHVGP